MTPTLAPELPLELSEASVLRAAAHEIRQPLSAIESIAYFLSLLPDNEKHREQLSRVQQLVEQSSWILSNSLALTDPRRAAPQLTDLDQLISETISLRPSSMDPPVIRERVSSLPLVPLDPSLARTLLENIFGLFRQLATLANPMRVRTSAASNGVQLEVSTSAPGYRSIHALPPGSVLSLDCSRRIAALHGGSCTFSIDPASGILVRVMLP
jgi:signal transduction histidine kinase